MGRGLEQRHPAIGVIVPAGAGVEQRVDRDGIGSTSSQQRRDARWWSAGGIGIIGQIEQALKDRQQLGDRDAEANPGRRIASDRERTQAAQLRELGGRRVGLETIVIDRSGP